MSNTLDFVSHTEKETIVMGPRHLRVYCNQCSRDASDVAAKHIAADADTAALAHEYSMPPAATSCSNERITALKSSAMHVNV